MRPYSLELLSILHVRMIGDTQGRFRRFKTNQMRVSNDRDVSCDVGFFADFIIYREFLALWKIKFEESNLY